MHAIGIDIGTTTICGVLVEGETGKLIASRTLPNDTRVDYPDAGAACQSPAAILAKCGQLEQELRALAPGVERLGLTGQMHGIVYLDRSGTPVSPLFTWQDSRGDKLRAGGQTYADYLSTAGYRMATGYGLTTHFYLLENNLVPPEAVVFCSIADFVAMALASETRPLVHPSMAAGFGLFDLKANRFDESALRLVGIDTRMLPELCREKTMIGVTGTGARVSVALGDNQASFLGSVRSDDTILVNVGTGSQVSILVSDVECGPGLEIRPFVGGNRLCVGSSLCGGESYAIVKRFLESAVAAFGGTALDAYDIMNRLAATALDSPDPLEVVTRFRGTREDPLQRGRIAGISSSNLTVGNLSLATLRGIVDELHGLYRQMPAPDKKPRHLLGSGNGIRKNPLLQKLFSERFGLPIQIPLYEEEAAYGAALHSIRCDQVR